MQKFQSQKSFDEFSPPAENLIFQSPKLQKQRKIFQNFLANWIDWRETKESWQLLFIEKAQQQQQLQHLENYLLD